MIQNSNIALFRQLLVKFGLLSREQIFYLFQDKLGRASIYDNLRRLARMGDLTDWRMPSRHKTLYLARSGLMAQAVYKSVDHVPSIHERFNELEHRLLCNEVFIHLCQRSTVTGITLEHELLRFPQWSPVEGKRPDGLVQIDWPEYGKIELAVEVERNVKSPARVREVISSYAESYRGRGDYPLGLLLVVTHPVAKRAYERELTEAPESVRSGIRLVSKTDLSELPEDRYGQKLDHPLQNPHQPWTTFRTASPKNMQYGPYNDLRYTHRDSSRTRRVKRDLKPHSLGS